LRHGALTAQAVADLVGGRLSGAGDLVLRRVRSLERAEPEDLAICSGGRWLAALATTKAGAVLVSTDAADAPGPLTRIVVDDPMRAMTVVATALADPGAASSGIDPTARIGAGAQLGAECQVGPYSVIGADVVLGSHVRIGALSVIEAGVHIGDHSVIEPRVVIHQGSQLGERVVVQAGAVIGGQGFGFLNSTEGHARVPQVGGCILEDDVEVGAGSCIDRGSLDDTIVGQGTKIDNLVHVAHNVRIGRHCLIMAGVGIAGSTRVGDGVVLAGQAGLAGHLDIGDGARIGAQAGVISSVPAKASYSGYPARPHREALRAQAALYRLAAHVDALEALVRRDDDA
jgi:UDP-3-O-[3-hydroxymyristoyl] glucosamine N-acyltransferase